MHSWAAAPLTLLLFKCRTGEPFPPKETLKPPVSKGMKITKTLRRGKMPLRLCLLVGVVCDSFSHWKSIDNRSVIHSECLVIKTAAGVIPTVLPGLEAEGPNVPRIGLPSRKQACLEPSPCPPPYLGNTVIMITAKRSKSVSQTQKGAQLSCVPAPTACICVTQLSVSEKGRATLENITADKCPRGHRNRDCIQSSYPGQNIGR